VAVASWLQPRLQRPVHLLRHLGEGEHIGVEVRNRVRSPLSAMTPAGTPACQLPRGRVRARTGSVEVHEAATRLGVAQAELPRHVVAAPEYPTAATLASAACCAVMRAHEEPRIVVVRSASAPCSAPCLRGL
jgi:hypothetical protein